MAPEDVDAVRDAFTRVHPVRPTEVEGSWLTTLGERRVIAATIAHILDGQGLHRRILAGLDVTDLIAEREEARRQRDFLSVVAVATPSLLAVVEADGTVAIEGVNRAFAEATGYDDETAPGKRFWDLVVPPELRDEFKADFAAAVRDASVVEHETAWRGAAGERRLIEWSCRPLPQIGKFLICGVDITERKRQADEVRASRARIVEAGDAERRRLERNLHDGAQQRLVSLSLALRLAQARLRDDPEGAEKLLTGAAEELTHAIGELRELARGIHPAVLTDRGLPAALEALAARAPLPVELTTSLDDRLPGAGGGGRLLRRRRGAHQRGEVRGGVGGAGPGGTAERAGAGRGLGRRSRRRQPGSRLGAARPRRPRRVARRPAGGRECGGIGNPCAGGDPAGGVVG